MKFKKVLSVGNGKEANIASFRFSFEKMFKDQKTNKKLTKSEITPEFMHVARVTVN